MWAAGTNSVTLLPGEPSHGGREDRTLLVFLNLKFIYLWTGPPGKGLLTYFPIFLLTETTRHWDRNTLCVIIQSLTPKPVDLPALLCLHQGLWVWLSRTSFLTGPVSKAFASSCLILPYPAYEVLPGSHTFLSWSPRAQGLLSRMNKNVKSMHFPVLPNGQILHIREGDSWTPLPAEHHFLHFPDHPGSFSTPTALQVGAAKAAT